MKKTLILLVAMLLFSQLASAVIFDVEKARKEELERYKDYRENYIQNNDLEAYAKYVSESNLRRNFGFRGPGYYYIPPEVLEAKYNPPLQGDVYFTPNRGHTTSLEQPSAVKYYGAVINGRPTGYVKGDLNGKYFDHPHIDAVYGHITVGGGARYGAHNYNNRNDNFENSKFYARVASPINNDFYVVGFQ